jgi:hypothetical protein
MRYLTFGNQRLSILDFKTTPKNTKKGMFTMSVARVLFDPKFVNVFAILSLTTLHHTVD